MNRFQPGVALLLSLLWEVRWAGAGGAELCWPAAPPTARGGCFTPGGRRGDLPSVATWGCAASGREAGSSFPAGVWVCVLEGWR